MRPSLAFVLGSGFHAVGAAVRATLEVDYANLPGLPIPRVAGHAGRLSVGYLGPSSVIVLSGRCHYYEGHSMAAVTLPVRMLAEFGVRDLILTNAAGGINPRFRPGDFMLATDHLNLMGANPLRGSTESRNNFVDLTDAHNPRLRKLLKQAATQRKTPLRTGIYAAVSGPSYETPAEVRALARLGADAVGMSTVPEIIVARQYGVNVAAISCITNRAAGLGKTPLSHAEVLSTAHKSQAKATDLLLSFAELYATASG